MADSSGIARTFGVDTEGAKEARAVLSSTLSSILGSTDRNGSRRSVPPTWPPETTSAHPFSPSTSASRTTGSPGTRFSWDRLLVSDDEDVIPDGGSVSRSNAPPDCCSNKTASGGGVGGNASDDDSTDDEAWKEHFANRGADAAAAARQQRAAIPEAHIQANEGGNRASGSSSSSPRGSARKRPRETGDSHDAGKKPAPPCRSYCNSEGGSSSSRDEDGGPTLTGERQRCISSPGCYHSSDVGTSDGRGRSPPPSVSLGGDHGVGDRNSSVSASGGASSRGGTDAEQRGWGQGMDEEEEEEEVEKKGARKREAEEDIDEEDVDLLEERLKPTLSNAPFEDPVMRPLVLINDEGGQRAEVPASVNRYLKDYQREGVSACCGARDFLLGLQQKGVCIEEGEQSWKCFLWNT